MRGCISSLFFLLLSCSHDPRMGASIEAPFLPYVDAFEHECGCKVLDVPITFSKLQDSHVGECQNYVVLTESFSEIFIDREYWDSASIARREQLIFHELGHCVLRREHLLTKRSGFPISLMYPEIDRIPDFWYAIYRKIYLDELFQRGEFATERRTSPIPK